MVIRYNPRGNTRNDLYARYNGRAVQAARNAPVEPARQQVRVNVEKSANPAAMMYLGLMTAPLVGAAIDLIKGNKKSKIDNNTATPPATVAPANTSTSLVENSPVTEKSRKALQGVQTMEDAEKLYKEPSDEEDLKEMYGWDKDGDNALNFEEYKNGIYGMLDASLSDEEKAQIKQNPSKFNAMIKTSFDSMDTKKLQKISFEDLKTNASTAIEKLCSNITKELSNGQNTEGSENIAAE